MRKIIQLLIILCYASLCWRCDDPDMGKEFAAYEDFPVGRYLETLPEYSDWVKMLKRSKYFDGVNVGTSFTCFVANNTAVGHYLNNNNYSSVDDIPEDHLKVLMGYHIIAGVEYTAIMFNGTLSSETFSGDYLSVKPRIGGIQELYVNEKSKITRKDDECLNGIIHHLEYVLEPIVTPIWTILQEPRYSIFYSACQEVKGLEDYLTVRTREVGEAGEDGLSLSMREYKTVLVVSDSIFKENGIESLDDLKKEYPPSGDSTNIKSLENFIKYHIVKGFMDFSTLCTFGEYNTDKRKVIGTLAHNQVMTVTDDRGFLVFNKANGENFKLVSGKIDIQASNGYIHEIGGLLPVEAGEHGVVAWELTDYDCFRVLPVYKKWLAELNMVSYPIDREYAEECGIIWNTIPDNEQAVRYHFRDWVDMKDADVIYSSLGNVGWMEFTTPVIPAGKYTIRIHRIAYDSRGVYNMYIDGGFFRELVFSTNEVDDLGTKDFAIQSTHKIKFAVKKLGPTEIDQIIFIPVK